MMLATLGPPRPPHHHLLLNAFVSLAQAELLDAALEVLGEVETNGGWLTGLLAGGASWQ